MVCQWVHLPLFIAVPFVVSLFLANVNLAILSFLPRLLGLVALNHPWFITVTVILDTCILGL